MNLRYFLSTRDVFGYIIPGGVLIYSFLILRNWIINSLNMGEIVEINMDLFNGYSVWKWVTILVLSIGVGFINAAVVSFIAFRLGKFKELELKQNDSLAGSAINLLYNIINLFIKKMAVFSGSLSQVVMLKDVVLKDELKQKIIEFAIEDFRYYKLDKTDASKEIQESVHFLFECRDKVYMNHRNDTTFIILDHIDRLSSKEKIMLNLIFPVMLLSFIVLFGFYRKDKDNSCQKIYVNEYCLSKETNQLFLQKNLVENHSSHKPWIFFSIAIMGSLVAGFICKKSHAYWRMCWAQEVYLMYYLSTTKRNR